jgi:GH18 family chitinase
MVRERFKANRGSSNNMFNDEPCAGFYERVVALKRRGVKVSIGLGGWNDSAGDKYSRLVNNRSSRKKFIYNVLNFMDKYGFEGLDLDWEYPKCWQVQNTSFIETIIAYKNVLVL